MIKFQSIFSMTAIIMLSTSQQLGYILSDESSSEDMDSLTKEEFSYIVNNKLDTYLKEDLVDKYYESLYTSEESIEDPSVLMFQEPQFIQGQQIIESPQIVSYQQAIEAPRIIQNQEVFEEPQLVSYQQAIQAPQVIQAPQAIQAPQVIQAPAMVQNPQVIQRAPRMVQRAPQMRMTRQDPDFAPYPDEISYQPIHRRQRQSNYGTGNKNAAAFGKNATTRSDSNYYNNNGRIYNKGNAWGQSNGKRGFVYSNINQNSYGQNAIQGGTNTYSNGNRAVSVSQVRQTPYFPN